MLTAKFSADGKGQGLKIESFPSPIDTGGGIEQREE
jgi:hypothetical protein